MLTGRAAASLALAAAAPLVLSACTQPFPRVAAYVNGQTAFADFSVYCLEGQSIDANDCEIASVDPPALEMKPFLDRVGIDVPLEIAEHGYVVQIGGVTQGRIQRSTYVGVPISLPDGEQTTMRVLALSAPEESAEVTGVWRFTLRSGENAVGGES